MGGRVCSSRARSGRGSTFSFTDAVGIARGGAPTCRGSCRSRTRGAATSAPAAASCVAEDNPVNQLLARRLLEKAGHDVTVVEHRPSPPSTRSRATRFDAVLMDVQMPEMDGFDATSRIRGAEAGRLPPADHRA